MLSQSTFGLLFLQDKEARMIERAKEAETSQSPFGLIVTQDKTMYD